MPSRTGVRRLAVADIHGCARQLEQVLSAARYDPERDRLFLLGDYVDRGPEPARAVELARELQRQGAVVLRGNHDHSAAESGSNPEVMQVWTDPRNGGNVTLADYGGRVPDDVAVWICSLPLYHEEPNCILVHAGLRPCVKLENQLQEDMLWIRETFHRHYSGKLVIFGHTPTNLLHGKLTPWYGVDKIGIDTGACFANTHGGCLTLFDIDTHQTWTA